MESKTNKRSSFERLSLEYVFAGKYKGEWEIWRQLHNG
jgi:hypothetical protein